jgi:hypothetical protein
MSQSQKHVRGVPRDDADKPRERFTGVNDKVRLALGGHRGAKDLYGVLCTMWYENATPEVIRERRKAGLPIPGDWVSVGYQRLGELCGTSSPTSIRRWILQLSESFWECHRCSGSHPLIWVKIGDRNHTNSYRRWNCDQDKPLVKVRPKIRRPRKPHNPQTSPTLFAGGEKDGSITETVIEKPDESRTCDYHNGNRSTTETVIDVPSERESTYSQNGRHITTRTDLKSAPIGLAAADKSIDDVEIVAGEVAYLIVDLGHITDARYGKEQAWRLACLLASAVLEQTPDISEARAALRRAVEDPRIPAVRNPLGYLRSGVLGDETGGNRYLLDTPRTAKPVQSRPQREKRDMGGGLAVGLRDHLVAMLRSGESPSAEWLRERHIRADVVAELRAEIGAQPDEEPPSFPLGDALSREDPDVYQRRLHEVLAKLPSVLGPARSLDRPAILGMCRAQLEVELRQEAEKRTS